MNKKGFTFIELLAVIVIIAIVIGITIPSVRYADQRFHEKAYKTKIELIKKAAENYGDDYREIILNSNAGVTYTLPVEYGDENAYPAVYITVRDLLNNGYITRDDGLKEPDVLDPRTDETMLNIQIVIYIKNNRAYAIINPS